MLSVCVRQSCFWLFSNNGRRLRRSMNQTFFTFFAGASESTCSTFCQFTATNAPAGPSET